MHTLKCVDIHTASQAKVPHPLQELFFFNKQSLYVALLHY